jgi:hypothetical protein
MMRALERAHLDPALRLAEPNRACTDSRLGEAIDSMAPTYLACASATRTRPT